MPDVTTTVTIPASTTIVGIAVRWVRNGNVLTKNHPVVSGTIVYTFSYLTDAGATGFLNPGDVVSVSATAYDTNNVFSTTVPSVPVSVTVPVIPTPAPTSVTIANS